VWLLHARCWDQVAIADALEPHLAGMSSEPQALA
jgi:hypothetical protein